VAAETVARQNRTHVAIESQRSGGVCLTAGQREYEAATSDRETRTAAQRKLSSSFEILLQRQLVGHGVAVRFDPMRFLRGAGTQTGETEQAATRIITRQIGRRMVGPTFRPAGKEDWQ
jgi:hypothetical protein